MQEIERKFLVHRECFFSRFVTPLVSRSLICQGYMDVKGATVRVRLYGEKAFLTIKGPSLDGGLSRYEFERKIPVSDAKEMMKLCRGGVIEKTRYLIPFEGHTFEVDDFHGANEGLLFAEVELGSADEEFAKPEFLGPEVTGNPHFYNKHLLKESYPTWKHEIPEAFQ